MLIRIEASSFTGAHNFIIVDGFWVEGAGTKYILHSDGELVSGNETHLVDWYYHNGQMFSAYDRKNDESNFHCALTKSAGWWYKSCQEISPNGIYRLPQLSCVRLKSIHWYSWLGSETCLKNISIAIKSKH